jgi:hypothetical protein
VGIVADGGGKNSWRLEQSSGWGRAEWSRGLPSIGLVLGDAPRHETPAVHEAETEAPCSSADPLQQQRLREDVVGTLTQVPAEDFDRLWPLAAALRCALAGASGKEAQSMWDGVERLAATPYAGLIAAALRARPAPPEQMRRIVGTLAGHPSCGVRTAALQLDGSAAAAQAALRSSCWRLQARALRILGKLGVAPASLDGVPDFLR